jgi:hypothetical protein
MAVFEQSKTVDHEGEADEVHVLAGISTLWLVRAGSCPRGGG